MKKVIPALSFLIIATLAGFSQELEYKKRVVFEEVAATSCKWCPRAIVGMELLEKKYPDSFIGIVVHTAKDPMMVDSYIWPLAEYIESYPIAVVNRKKTGDPYFDGENLYLKEMEQPATSAIAVSAAYEQESSDRLAITIHTKFAFSTDISNYRIAFAITENGVTGPSPGYDQANTYAGANTIMGGFEQLPNPVPASQMKYNHVARAIFPAFEGLELIIAPTIIKDDIYSFEISDFYLPDNILNKDSVEIIALLLEGTSGEIINAAKTSTISGNPVHNEKITQSGFDAKVYSDSKGMRMDISSADNHVIDVEVFSVSGVRIYKKKIKANGSFYLPSKADRSFCIVKVSDGKNTIVRKVYY